MVYRNILSLVLIVFLGFSAAGCGALILGGAAAGGAYVYVAGKATQKFNSDLGTTYKAGLAACKDLDLKIEDGKKRLSEATIKAVDVDTTVLIDFKSVGSKITEVTVRYGILGDEQASSRILTAIKGNL